MRKLSVALIATFTVAIAPAAEGKTRQRQTNFTITSAIGYVRVTFHGDEAAGCRQRGVCAVNGSIKRSYERPTFGNLLWLRRGTRTLFLYAFLDEGRGTIAADVGTAGSPERCVDRLRTGYDRFLLQPRGGRLRFVWREVAEDGAFIIGGDHEDDEVPPEDLFPNPFGTRCPGPELLDLNGALPTGDIPFRVLRSRRSQIHLTGSRPFAAGGFAGTVDWKLRYGLRLQRSRVLR
ncbi:MAG: hypothetical protein M3340_11055 [Actinomycetota bacterium]|nr:hypothetical protein [Actinomycetota bacterium]